jgi:hypothetical protein
VVTPSHSRTNGLKLKSFVGEFPVLVMDSNTWVLEPGAYRASEVYVSLNLYRERVLISLLTTDSVHLAAAQDQRDRQDRVADQRPGHADRVQRAVASHRSQLRAGPYRKRHLPGPTLCPFVDQILAGRAAPTARE